MRSTIIKYAYILHIDDTAVQKMDSKKYARAALAALAGMQPERRGEKIDYETIAAMRTDDCDDIHNDAACSVCRRSCRSGKQFTACEC